MTPHGTAYDSWVDESEPQIALTLDNVHKSFGRFPALAGVTLDFNGGEVHGLVGANGAGKSTLIKVVGGVHAPDRGTLRLTGAAITFASPRDAAAAGISVVHQETQIFPELSVAENLVAGCIPSRRLLGVPVRSSSRAHRLCHELLAELEVDLDPAARTGNLELAQKKLVQIARSLVSRPRLLVLDEPTAALEASQSALIVELLRKLASRGLSVVFVSHKLDEVVACSERVSVLADGRLVADLRAGSPALTAHRLSDLVAGRKLSASSTEHLAAVDGYASPLASWSPNSSALNPGGDIVLRPREVVTVAGLLGSGAAQAVRELAGSVRSTRATVTLGRTALNGSRAQASRLGVGFVPQERKRDGILPDLSVEQNIALSSLSRVSTFGVRRPRSIRRQAERLIGALDIRPADPTLKAGALSGGNQQKVLLARWLAAGARILVVEEPTHGIDVGAKQQVIAALRDFADRGGAVVVSALETDEFVAISHRFAVFRRQALVLNADAPVDLDQVWSAVLGGTDTPMYSDASENGVST